MSSADVELLREALLRELAAAPAGVSLPRLCKRLSVRMSVLMRTLAWIGEDAIGGVPGAGLVRVIRDGERELATLTERGRALAAGSRPADRHAQGNAGGRPPGG